MVQIAPHLGQQFAPFTGGPEEAVTRHLQTEYGFNEAGARMVRAYQTGGSDPGQERLFHPEHLPAQEPHHQTPEQFARDPRTWWHGRVMTESPRSRLPGKPAGRDEGFHAGTQAAARQRVTYNIKRRGLPEGKVGRMFPLRITGPVRGPEEAKPDVMRHRELGAWGSHGGAGYLYRNVVEGREGELSVGTPTRKGYLSTHKEMVIAAERRGESVHPTISWAARHAPEHTGEAIRESGRYRLPKEEGYQQGLHEQFPGSSIGRNRAFQELHPERTRTHRTSYMTEGGRQKHAWAFSTELPGSALMSKQWSPSS